MNRGQTIVFGGALALLEGVSVAVLHVLDATQEAALLVVLLIAAIGGTLLGVFGERTEEDREAPGPGTLHERPHGG